MTMVPAGFETGDYYLIIGNIRFSAGWKDLKDFIRNGDPVIGHGPYPSLGRVHIHDGLGSGWACFGNRAEFLDAGKFLANAIFEGKVLMPDTRNVNSPVSLGTAPPLPYSRRLSSTGYNQSQSSSSTNSRRDSPGQVYQSPSQPGQSAVPPQIQYPGNAPPNTLFYSTSLVEQFEAQRLYNSTAHPQDFTVSSTANPQAQYADTSRGGAHVRVEWRGLHMSNVGHRTTEQEIRHFIRMHTNLPDSALESFQRGRQANGSPRSHCVVVMNSVAQAERAQATCHRQVLNGNIIKVKIDSQGVTHTSGLSVLVPNAYGLIAPPIASKPVSSSGTSSGSIYINSPAVVDGSGSSWGSPEDVSMLSRIPSIDSRQGQIRDSSLSDADGECPRRGLDDAKSRSESSSSSGDHSGSDSENEGDDTMRAQTRR